MAFNFGALLTGVNRGLTGYRQGQMLGEDQRAAQEMAAREAQQRENVALFNAWAKRRQLGIDEGALRQREAAANDLSQYRAEQNDLRRMIAEQGSWIQKAQAGLGGTVDRTNQSREGMNTQDNQTALEVARLRAALAERLAAGKAASQPPREVPSGMADKIGEGNALASLTELASTALAAIPDGTNSTGPITGRLSGLRQMVGMDSPQVVQFRQTLANIGSQLLHARSGGAVTPQEFQRLEPLVPSKNDPEDVVKTKLAGLKRELDLVNQERLNALGDAGYNTSRFEQRRGGAQPPPSDDLDARAAALIQKYRSGPP